MCRYCPVSSLVCLEPPAFPESDRRADAREAFAHVAETAANLAYDAAQLPADLTFAAVCDARRDAWREALDTRSFPWERAWARGAA